MVSLVFLVAALVVGLDRLTKTFIQTRMVLNESHPVIKGIFSITFVRNPGAAFSLLANQTPLLVIVALAAVGMIIYYARREEARDPLLRFALGLQLGGALGNLYDRLTGGTVVDFLDFHIWPVFNVADMAVVSGVILFMYYLFFREKAGEPAR